MLLIKLKTVSIALKCIYAINTWKDFIIYALCKIWCYYHIWKNLNMRINNDVKLKNIICDSAYLLLFILNFLFILFGCLFFIFSGKLKLDF
jgi:hypothetical protein